MHAELRIRPKRGRIGWADHRDDAPRAERKAGFEQAGGGDGRAQSAALGLRGNRNADEYCGLGKARGDAGQVDNGRGCLEIAVSVPVEDGRKASVRAPQEGARQRRQACGDVQVLDCADFSGGGFARKNGNPAAVRNFEFRKHAPGLDHETGFVRANDWHRRRNVRAVRQRQFRHGLGCAGASENKDAPESFQELGELGQIESRREDRHGTPEGDGALCGCNAGAAAVYALLRCPLEGGSRRFDAAAPYGETRINVRCNRRC